jgi:hypothetical protein
VLRLIREGADVNVKNAAGGTPLHYVLNWASHNHSRYVAKTRDGGTPLHEACYGSRVEVMKFLIGKGADVDAKCTIGATPLHSACYHGPVEAVRFLIEKGADINAKDDHTSTPLHDACRMTERNNISVVKLLTKMGAHVNAVDDCGERPIDVAESCGNDPIVKFLKWFIISFKENPDGLASHAEVEKWLSEFLPERDAAKYMQHLIMDGFDSMEILKQVLEEKHLCFMKTGHKRMTMKKLDALRQA